MGARVTQWSRTVFFKLNIIVLMHSFGHPYRQARVCRHQITGSVLAHCGQHRATTGPVPAPLLGCDSLPKSLISIALGCEQKWYWIYMDKLQNKIFGFLWYLVGFVLQSRIPSFDQPASQSKKQLLLELSNSGDLRLWLEPVTLRMNQVSHKNMNFDSIQMVVNNDVNIEKIYLMRIIITVIYMIIAENKWGSGRKKLIYSIYFSNVPWQSFVILQTRGDTATSAICQPPCTVSRDWFTNIFKVFFPIFYLHAGEEPCHYDIWHIYATPGRQS